VQLMRSKLQGSSGETKSASVQGECRKTRVCARLIKFTQLLSEELCRRWLRCREFPPNLDTIFYLQVLLSECCRRPRRSLNKLLVYFSSTDAFLISHSMDTLIVRIIPFCELPDSASYLSKSSSPTSVVEPTRLCPTLLLPNDIDPSLCAECDPDLSFPLTVPRFHVRWKNGLTVGTQAAMMTIFCSTLMLQSVNLRRCSATESTYKPHITSGTGL
jgi:hypothetical protein